MSEPRAILVSDAERASISNAVSDAYGFHQDHVVWPSEDATFREEIAPAEAFLERADAAGDQPRILWCVAEHSGPQGQEWPHGDVNWKRCRVVDAIVVPLPEQP